MSQESSVPLPSASIVAPLGSSNPTGSSSQYAYRFRLSGGTDSWLAGRQPLRYRSYYWDCESGLYYLPARYYDPATARFLTADPASPSVGNPLSLNRYAYCEDEPIAHTDPSGAIMPEFYNHDDRAKVGEVTVARARLNYSGEGGMARASKKARRDFVAAVVSRLMLLPEYDGTGGVYAQSGSALSGAGGVTNLQIVAWGLSVVGLGLALAAVAAASPAIGVALLAGSVAVTVASMGVAYEQHNKGETSETEYRVSMGLGAASLAGGASAGGPIVRVLTGVTEVHLAVTSFGLSSASLLK